MKCVCGRPGEMEEIGTGAGGLFNRWCPGCGRLHCRSMNPNFPADRFNQPTILRTFDRMKLVFNRQENILKNILTDSQLDTRGPCGRTIRDYTNEVYEIQRILAGTEPKGWDLLLHVFTKGVKDAIDQGGTLSSGMTYDDPVLSETYDKGANLGEELFRNGAETNQKLRTALEDCRPFFEDDYMAGVISRALDVKVHAFDEDKKRGIMHVSVTPVKGPEVVVTAEAFKAATGHDSQHDDLDRCNCPDVGEVGHHACGWCKECNGPRFMCAHLLFNARDEERKAPGEEGAKNVGKS